MERCCVIDVNQLPLCPNVSDPNLLWTTQDPMSIRTELVNLKSPLVLQMLEKRMLKGLLSKICAKVLMTTMAGDSTSISTLQFLKHARKISGKIEIKAFADEWIFASGCPIFQISYNFNTKKMVIELRIRQKSSNYGVEGGAPKFSGPFTVRVQEPGGTFDTEIRIEDYSKLYDIIYHTKYKRIRKKHGKKKKAQAIEEEDDEMEEFEVDESKQEDGVITIDMDSQIAEPDRYEYLT
jgi:hypothetical protein